jgi:predicted transcriptional regulator
MEPMSDQVLSLAAQIVSAHVAHNTVPAQELPALIQSVYTTLAHAGAPVVETGKAQPAVPVKKSVFPDHIVCLEDGKKLKMLKRHLQSRYSLTPDQYREKWGLPRDYPMVAPNYAQTRSALAKSIGLGRKPGAEAAPETDVPRVRRGRKKAA